MSIALNHHIVWCRDQGLSADFLTELFDLPPARHWGPFMIVELANGVSLDYHETDGEIASQHYAFLVSDDEFDAIFGRIVEQDIEHWADRLASADPRSVLQGLRLGLRTPGGGVHDRESYSAWLREAGFIVGAALPLAGTQNRLTTLVARRP